MPLQWRGGSGRRGGRVSIVDVRGALALDADADDAYRRQPHVEVGRLADTRDNRSLQHPRHAVNRNQSWQREWTEERVDPNTI